MKSFIVGCLSKIFNILGWMSPFQVLRWAVRKKFSATSKIYHFVESYYSFVELWVLGHLILSIILLSIVSPPNLRWWEVVAFYFGIIRVWEIFIYQINVLLFAEYRAKREERRLQKEGKTYVPFALRGYRRIVILLLLNYVEIIFWFALFYRILEWSFDTTQASLNSSISALHFSIATITGFGSTSIFPTGTWGYVFTSSQMAIGVFMALGIIARFISLLPQSKTLDEFER